MNDKETTSLKDTIEALRQAEQVIDKLRREVAEHKHTNEALRESEEYYRTFFENSLDAVLLTSPDGSVHAANDAACRMFGMTEREIIEGGRDKITDTTDPRLKAALEERARTGRFRGELNMKRKDGTIFPVDESNLVFADKNGRSKTVMILRDITERRKTENALKESEKRYRSLFENISEGVAIGEMIYDDTGKAVDYRFIDINPACEKFLGFSRDQIIGKTVRTILPNAQQKAIEIFGKLAQTGESVHFENYSRDLNRWFDLYAYQLQPGKICYLSFDITERKQAEEALKTKEAELQMVADMTPVILNRISGDLRYIFVNHACCRLFNKTREEIVGKSIIEIMGRPAFEAILPYIERVLRGEQVQYETEIPYKEAGPRFMHVIYAPEKNNQNKVIGWFASVIDITERKQAEDELRNAEKALRHLNETLEQRITERTFLAEARTKQLQGLTVELIEAEERERRRVARLLHDDLQQILAAARMQLEAVFRKNPEEPMLANAMRMLSLSIDKSRSLSHELSPPVLYSSGIIQALHWLAGHMKEQFGLQVGVEENINRPLENDHVKVFIFHAVRELLFNIVKHSGVRYARVFLSTSAGRVDITVRDRGKGFNPQILDSAAAPAGFGLISIRERARHIGGDFVIESAPDRGSSFTLSIPLNLANTYRLQQQVINVQPAVAGVPPVTDQEGIRVLFVDDHIVTRQGLISLMESRVNIIVAGEASNGLEAIEQVRKLRPNVVVMDIGMPKMDGVEATKRIKAEWPNICVIGLSMLDDENIIQRMREAGAEDLVSKAAPASELLKVIYKITMDRSIPCST